MRRENSYKLINKSITISCIISDLEKQIVLRARRFILVLIFRILEKRLEENFACSQILRELREMNLLEVSHEDYIPTYTRTDFTDALHDAFGFRTDFQITTLEQMKKIFKLSKR